MRENLEGLLAHWSLREQPTPRFIEQELRAFPVAAYSWIDWSILRALDGAAWEPNSVLGRQYETCGFARTVGLPDQPELEKG